LVISIFPKVINIQCILKIKLGINEQIDLTPSNSKEVYIALNNKKAANWVTENQFFHARVKNAPISSGRRKIGKADLI